ncbi:PIN domain-containing protein [Kineococcus sp. SYSU DK005]|uniref:hypothetical protein n=1 Tax=Kineococcus sp. SYSU DK005 TaxID=3383126 RepID=UPI003D7F060F
MTQGEAGGSDELSDSESALVLVDFGSVVPATKTQADVIEGLELVTELLPRVLIPAPLRRNVIDVRIRLYGGFFAREGTATQQYSFLAREHRRQLGGLSNGLRVVSELAVALACRPDARIIGTYRGGRQRMVDQMLAQDALFLANQYDLLGLVSDDEDFFPVVLALSQATSMPIRWLRQRIDGRNDGYLANTNVAMLQDAAWVNEVLDSRKGRGGAND